MLLADYLPGVFTSNYYPEVVNGSLWTLPAEARCYTFLFFAGFLNILKNPRILIAIFTGITLLFITDHLFINGIAIGRMTVKLLIFFLAGSLSYAYRKFIIIDYRIALLLVLLTVASYFSYFHIVFLYITMIYAALAIGVSGIFKKLHLPGDYSYGVYIFGFLVQQIVSHTIPGLSSYTSLLITMPLTFILATASWHLIEKPAMAYANKLAKKHENPKKPILKDTAHTRFSPMA